MAHLPLARRLACIGSASVAILALAAGTAQRSHRLPARR
jgi:hypothetical protein